MLLIVIIVLFSLSLYLTQIPFLAEIDMLPIDSVFINNLIKNTGFIDFGTAVMIAMCMGILTIAVTILQTVKATKKPQLVKGLIDGILVIKLINVPFFAFNFVIYAMIAALLSITGIGMPLTIIVGAFVAGCVLIITSLYTVVVLYRCKKMNLLSTTSFVIFIISQFFFCIDVIFAVVAYFIVRKRYNKAAKAQAGQAFNNTI